MKRRCSRIAIAFLALFAFAAHDARAQNEDLARTPSQTATLLSDVKHEQKDYSKSIFYFSLGVRGDSATLDTRYYFDLRYGGISENGNDHWFDVPMCGDSRRKLQDLGELKWSDVYYVPAVFALPEPNCEGAGWRYEDGKVVEITPEGVNVRAVAGHIYVMRVKDDKSDFYVMFRVESLPEGECVITWKRVPSPGEDRPADESEKPSGRPARRTRR